MRKPKKHFGISTKGINFRERWNIVLMSTKEEFQEYIKLENNAVKDFVATAKFFRQAIHNGQLSVDAMDDICTNLQMRVYVQIRLSIISHHFIQFNQFMGNNTYAFNTFVNFLLLG